MYNANGNVFHFIHDIFSGFRKSKQIMKKDLCMYTDLSKKNKIKYFFWYQVLKKTTNCMLFF